MSRKKQITPLQKKKRTIRGIIAFLFIDALLISGFLFARQMVNEAKVLRDQARTIKNELKVVAQDVKDQNTEAAEAKMDEILVIADEAEQTLNTSRWKFASTISYRKIGENITGARTLLNILRNADSTVIRPVIRQMAEHPMVDFKAGEDGFYVSWLNSYLDFAEQMMPELGDLANQLSDVTDLSLVDTNGTIMKYRNEIVGLGDYLDDINKYFPALRAIIGDGSDKLYVIVAQNSAEMRAGGGFPGSIGSMRIQDGVLTIGDFTAVANAMWMANPAYLGVDVSNAERMIFAGMMNYSGTAASFNPDFGRAGEIFGISYDAVNGTDCDGVISLTPAVVQKLLSLADAEFTLSDGTVVNGNNCTKILQHDLYYRYLGANRSDSDGNAISDALFEETASQAMKVFVKSISMSNIVDYIKFFRDSAADRTLMIWMADDAQQQAMIDAGISGVLNPGTPNAKCGIYFSIMGQGSKKGWFVDLQPVVNSSAKNEDGTISYDVSVTMNDVITDQEINEGSYYILGDDPYTIDSGIYFFAPSGGNITNFSIDNGAYFSQTDYMGLPMVYLYTYIRQNQPVTAHFTITTAAEVTDELTFITTPLLTAYRTNE